MHDQRVLDLSPLRHLLSVSQLLVYTARWVSAPQDLSVSQLLVYTALDCNNGKSWLSMPVFTWMCHNFLCTHCATAKHWMNACNLNLLDWLQQHLRLSVTLIARKGKTSTGCVKGESVNNTRWHVDFLVLFTRPYTQTVQHMCQLYGINLRINQLFASSARRVLHATVRDLFFPGWV